MSSSSEVHFLYGHLPVGWSGVIGAENCTISFSFGLAELLAISEGLHDNDRSVNVKMPTESKKQVTCN